MSTDTASFEWGPAAVGTLILLTALAVGAGAGVGLFWISATYDGRALAHTLVLAAVVADVTAMAWISGRLYRMHRRQR